LKNYFLKSSQLFDSINKYRLHIAALYFFLIYSYIYTKNTVYSPLFTCLAFTLCLIGCYIFNRGMDYEADTINNSSEALKSKYFLAISGIAFTLPIFYFIYSGQPIIPYLFFVFSSILYSYKFKSFRIKDLFLFKNLWAALSWTLSIYIINQIYLRNQPMTMESFLGFIKYFYPLFITILTFEIFYDLKDIVGDRKVGTKTIPTFFGFNKSKYIISSLFALQAAFLFTKHQSIFRIWIYALIIILLIFIKQHSSQRLYHLPVYGFILHLLLFY